MRYISQKLRLYPNRRQTRSIDSTFGACRFIYNQMLERQTKIFRRHEWNTENGSPGHKKHLSYIDMQNLLPGMKGYLPWLKDSDSQAEKYACRQLDAAFQAFFRKGSGYPGYKSRKCGSQSYTTTSESIRITGQRIKLPCIGMVRFRGKARFQGRIRKCTVSRTPSGEYFASLLLEDPGLPPEADPPAPDAAVGIDLGTTDFAVLSDGRRVGNPRNLMHSLDRLSRGQQKLSRMKRGSGRYRKQRLAVARAYRDVTNRRDDFINKLSKALMDENQAVCVEDLDIRGMMESGSDGIPADALRRRHLNIADASWGRFVSVMEGQAARRGRVLVRVGRFYPSSQTCSSCGHTEPSVKDLSIREWTCPVCGAHHDRDVNAAVNILSEGLRLIGG